MKIYIVERNNPKTWEEPEVYLDGKRAIEDIKKEYTTQMKELGISQKEADEGFGNYGCDWMIDEENYCGDCQISEDWGGDRWQWRITGHLI